MAAGWPDFAPPSTPGTRSPRPSPIDRSTLSRDGLSHSIKLTELRSGRMLLARRMLVHGELVAHDECGKVIPVFVGGVLGRRAPLPCARLRNGSPIDRLRALAKPSGQAPRPSWTSLRRMSWQLRTYRSQCWSRLADMRSTTGSSLQQKPCRG